MSLALRSHSGYRVRVFAVGSTIELQASRRSKSDTWETSTSYIARAKLDGDRLKASFGRLGEVSMRFVPAAKPPAARCERGRRRLVRHGTFAGSLRFSGEDDYLGVDVRHAKGAFVSESAARCRATPASRRERPGTKPRQKLTFLEAGFRTGLEAIYFQAIKSGTGRSSYSIVDEAGGEQLAIIRRAYAKASPLTFATDDALSFASISPPFPFRGTGLIQRRPDGSRSWSGSLAVSFPGDPNVTLTRPGFKTALVRQW